MLERIKERLFSNVIPRRYNTVIRGGVICLCFIGFLNTGGEVITFKHFDQESGVTCVLFGDESSPDFECHNDNLIGLNLREVSPVRKTWHYSLKDGYVDVVRQGYSKGMSFIATSDKFKGEKKFNLPFKE